jgi:DNA-binding MarR family transcriptional regulator
VNYQQRGLQPTLAAKTKLALTLSAKWNDRTDRKLIVLLAAFADAGERSPYARDLATRLDISVEELDRRLGGLAAEGLVWTVRRQERRNVYILLFNGDRVPDRDAKRYGVFERQRLERVEGRRERVPA